MSLEDSLVEKYLSGSYSIETILLIISGADSEEKLREYQLKIDGIIDDFLNHYEIIERPSYSDIWELTTASKLFDYLWHEKENRYGDDFLLKDVIDNQLNPKSKNVGSCLGLTSLYTVLGLRLGLNLITVSERKHMLSELIGENYSIFIENTNIRGFALGKTSKESKKGLKFLVSTAYKNRAFYREKNYDFEGAIDDCNSVLEIDPENLAAQRLLIWSRFHNTLSNIKPFNYLYRKPKKS